MPFCLTFRGRISLLRKETEDLFDKQSDLYGIDKMIQSILELLNTLINLLMQDLDGASVKRLIQVISWLSRDC